MAKGKGNRNTIRIRKGEYNTAEQRRKETRERTGLSLVWGDAIEHGINAIYDSYVANGKTTRLSNDEIQEIIHADPTGEGYTNIEVGEDQYRPAYRMKSELEDEWGLRLTWSDVLMVGVEEIFAQIDPSPQYTRDGLEA